MEKVASCEWWGKILSCPNIGLLRLSLQVGAWGLIQGNDSEQVPLALENLLWALILDRDREKAIFLEKSIEKATFWYFEETANLILVDTSWYFLTLSNVWPDMAGPAWVSGQDSGSLAAGLCQRPAGGGWWYWHLHTVYNYYGNLELIKGRVLTRTLTTTVNFKSSPEVQSRNRKTPSLRFTIISVC